MSSLQQLPQVSRVENSKSHTDKSVSLADSGGGKNSIKDKKKPDVNQEIYIATYNARTLRTEEHLEELIAETKSINWDIIGLSETRLQGEKCTQLTSGHVLYQRNADTNYTNGGVVLLINKKIKHKVTKFKAKSDRIIYTVLKINKRYTMQIIQAYAPTSNSEDEEAEEFYEDLSTTIKDEKSHYKLVMGDWNAKIGEKTEDDTEHIGKFGLGTRKKSGHGKAQTAL